MSQPTKRFFPSGKLEQDRYEVDRVPHRLGGPAVTYYHEDGSLDSEYWYFMGKLHREGGPAIIHHTPDGPLYGGWYEYGIPLSIGQIQDRLKQKKGE